MLTILEFMSRAKMQSTLCEQTVVETECLSGTSCCSEVCQELPSGLWDTPGMSLKLKCNQIVLKTCNQCERQLKTFLKLEDSKDFILDSFPVF